jgi:8-oxo-dGTP pyrophosphatase MutT (NUDIX family)
VNDALSDDDLRLVPTSGPQDITGFGIELSGAHVGTVALRHEARGLASLRWNLGAEGRGHGVALRALRLVVDYAFSGLGLHRIETRIDVTDTSSIRNASIAGLRREGIVRGFGEDPDQVLLARLASDPPPFSREGFIGILNAGLPKKRVISQGLLRDEHGRVLLCQLTYKQEWDLPGGVFEVGEAPASGLVRELQEELGITVEVKGFITVNWLPSWREWDDACIFLFDLGVVDSSITEGMTLQPTEIKAVEWCDEHTVKEHATSAATELLTAIGAGDIASYREAPLAD